MRCDILTRRCRASQELSNGRDFWLPIDVVVRGSGGVDPVHGMTPGDSWWLGREWLGGDGIASSRSRLVPNIPEGITGPRHRGGSPSSASDVRDGGRRNLRQWRIHLVEGIFNSRGWGKAE